MQPSIGVFDSGLGGLTVLAELRKVLPHHRLVYLGDCARLPWGTKSAQTVSAYALRCAEFLLQKEVQSIVIACNTASSVALSQLRAALPVPIHGVIQPGAEAAIEVFSRSAGRSGSERVVVLGTSSTVRSQAYSRELRQQGFQGEIVAVACPLLVSVAEEGLWDDPIADAVIRRYTGNLGLKAAEVVILGCTHFPLLRPSLGRVLPQGVQLIHGASKLARTLAEEVGPLPAEGSGELALYSTDVISLDVPMLKALSSVLPAGFGAGFEVVDLA